jgi:hypothetical protein
MKRRSVAAALGAVLVLSGCSQSVQGSAEAGSTVSSSTDSSTETSTEESTSTDLTTSEDTETTASQDTPTTSRDTETTETSDSTETTETSDSTETTETSDSTQTTGTSAARLDVSTVKWFTAFCQGVTDVKQYVSPSTANQSLKEIQATVVDTYTKISNSASTTIGVLQQAPPPDIPKGGALHQAAIDRFSALADVYGRGAQTIQDLKPKTTKDLQSAVLAIEKEATDAMPDTMADVGPYVLNAAKRLPACQGAFN